MLFQATVPNTWAAGVASQRTWPPRAPRAKAGLEIEGPRGTCECGRVKSRSKPACATCSRLDGKTDHEAFDDLVIDKFLGRGRLVLSQLIELFDGKLTRETLYRSVRRLVAAGRLHRKPVNVPFESYVYFIKG